jgi:hypothetical protein
MKQYGWALNPIKLQRAIVAAGTDASEEDVRAKYVEFGGLVAESAPVKAQDEEPKKKSK